MTISDHTNERHLPQPAPVEAYGNGGFRFGGMSHRGSLLCFPDGIWAWPVTSIAELTIAALGTSFNSQNVSKFARVENGRFG